MTAPAAPTDARSPLALAEVFFRLGLEDLQGLRFQAADRNLRLAQAFAPNEPQVTQALEQLFKAAHEARVRGAAATLVAHEDLPPVY